MKQYLSGCLILVAASAGAATPAVVTDPTVKSPVGAQREPVSCTLIDVPLGRTPEFAIGSAAMKAGEITVSTANPELKPLAAAPDLSKLPGTKSLWISSYSDYGVSTYSTTISLTEGNSYKMTPFIYADVELTFTVNTATGEVSIPVQKVAESEGNTISICKVDLKNGVYSPTDALAGAVVDGNLFIEDAFGFFVTQGPLVGHYLNIGILSQAVAGTSNTTFDNNAITFTNNEMTTANRKVTASQSPAFVYPLGADRLRILNVPVNATKRGAMTITLTSAGNAVVNPQPATVIRLHSPKIVNVGAADFRGNFVHL